MCTFGSKPFPGVTIVNKSSVVCVYSFSKSGNITSGFLNMSQGRKGCLAPFTTKNIDIEFKPTVFPEYESH
jgi:hypothetical protein